MNERIPCTNKECTRTILPTTAEETGGLCMPCFQAKKRQEEEEFIKKNKKQIDLFKGIDDKVEILRLMHTPRKYNRLEELIPYSKRMDEIYPTLNVEESKRLSELASDFLFNDDLDTAENILLHLACMTDFSIDSSLRLFSQHNHFYPDIIFRKAPNDIRDTIISHLQGSNPNRNHLLCALPWIDDNKVTDIFRKWKAHTPEWSNDLFIPPYRYSEQAGWILDSRNDKRSLVSKVCYPFVKEPAELSDPIIPISYSELECQWCKLPMVVLFEVDLKSNYLSHLGLQGDKLKIATCANCTCYGPIFTKVDMNGNFNWSKFNSTPDYLDTNTSGFEKLSERNIRFSSSTRSPFFAANQFLQTSLSQFGGYPTWIQDAEYLDCPQCRDKLDFIGQISHEDIDKYGEGIFYTHMCKRCMITGTNYQQA